MKPRSNKAFKPALQTLRKQPILFWCLCIVAMLAVLGSIATETISRRNFYNSDSVYLPLFYHDVVSGESVLGWRHPPAPYFFPDMLLYLALNFLSGSLHRAIMLFGVLQSVLFVSALLLLSNAVFGWQKSVHGLILWVSAIFFMFLSTGQCAAFLPIFQNGYHFGVMLSSLLSLLLILRLFDERTPWPQTILYSIVLGLLALVMLLSDALYLIQCIFPMFVVIWSLTLGSRLPLRRALIVSLALVPAIPLSYRLARVIFIFRDRGTVAGLTVQTILTNIRTALSEILHWHEHLWFSHDFLILFQVIWGAFMLGGIVVLGFALVKSPKPATARHASARFRIAMAVLTFTLGAAGVFSFTRQGEWAVWIGVLGMVFALWFSSKDARGDILSTERNFSVVFGFFLGSIVIDIGATLIVGGASPRYFLPALLIPLFFGWPFLVGKSPKFRAFCDRIWGHGLLLLVFAGIVTWLGGWGAFARIAAVPDLADYYPEFVACLDRETAARHLKNGLAQYWRAKYITALSKHGLVVVQARHGENQVLAMEHVINNINWYNREFEFILTGSIRDGLRELDTDSVVANFGEPADRFVCDGREVLVYNRPTDLHFRHLFMRELSFAADAVDLPSQTGRIEGASRIADDATHNTGALTFGPYVRLPIGEYRVNLQTVVQKHPEDDAIGKWEVVVYPSVAGEISAETSRTLKKGRITHTGQQTISERFWIREDNVRVEIRTYYTGKGTLKVDKIEIDRIR